MYDLISIGNISIDIFFKGTSLTLSDGRFQFAVGGKYFADSIFESLGGGGANVAIGGAKHGLKTAVLGQIGNNPFKGMILEKLKQSSVNHTFCEFSDNYFNISSIFLTESGDRSIVHYTTPHVHVFTETNKRNLLSARMVYLGNLPHVSFAEKVQLLRYLKHNNIFIVLNLGVEDCRRTNEELSQLLSLVNVFILNGYEFADLVKKKFESITFSDHVVQKYANSLSDTAVVVTLGKRGSYLYNGNKILHQKAFDVPQIVDTTGAGDAYIAGFTAVLHKTQSYEKAMEEGSKYASKILKHIGAN